MRSVKPPYYNRDAKWDSAEPQPHFCFPPKIYPDGYGSCSTWRCPVDDRVWQAYGYRVVGQYPTGSTPTGVVGPERWVLTAGFPVSVEEAGMYDWRNPVDVMLEWFKGKWGI